MNGCEHILAADRSASGNTEGCEECLKEGMRWVQLRVCLSCGHVGCCDSSVGKHATRHFRETGHPVMASFPDRSWLWCYIDEVRD